MKHLHRSFVTMTLVAVIFVSCCMVLGTAAPVTDHRPIPARRLFVSPAVDRTITEIASRMKDPNLAKIFASSFPNTLDTTVFYNKTPAGKPLPNTPKQTGPCPLAFAPYPERAFVITGDINAMWLRDSTNQLLSFESLLKEDKPLRDLYRAVIATQADQILIDSFANAFNPGSTCQGHQSDMRTPRMTCGVFEGKYELDSIAAVLTLAGRYYKHTNDPSIVTEAFIDSVTRIVTQGKKMQGGTDELASSPPYKFERTTHLATDTLMNYGLGPPAAKIAGLSSSMFRASDDSQVFPYHIPANAMFSVSLDLVADVLAAAAQELRLEAVAIKGGNGPVWNIGTCNSDTRVRTIETGTARLDELAKECRELAATLRKGIETAGVRRDANGNPYYVYEIDGFNNYYFMDDANIPSLLSLPMLGYTPRNSSIYIETRKRILSRATNPYYFSGSKFAGVGGPHIGYKFVWPMALIVQGLTADEGVAGDKEVADILEKLVMAGLAGNQGTPGQGYGFMKEAVHADGANRFTRPWFAWANGLFGQLILDVAVKRPHLIF